MNLELVNVQEVAALHLQQIKDNGYICPSCNKGSVKDIKFTVNEGKNVCHCFSCDFKTDGVGLYCFVKSGNANPEGKEFFYLLEQAASDFSIDRNALGIVSGKKKKKEFPDLFKCLANRNVSLIQRHLRSRGIEMEDIEIPTFVANSGYDLVLPMYNSDGDFLGAKVRLMAKTGHLKSLVKKGGKVGLLYDPAHSFGDSVYLCEGEIDYLTMWSWGFRDIVGNLGGVQSNKKDILEFCKNKKIKNLISCYDNDDAGVGATRSLKDQAGDNVNVSYVDFEKDEDIDINDLLVKYKWDRSIFLKAPVKQLSQDKSSTARQGIIEKKDGYYHQPKDPDARPKQLTNFTIEYKNHYILTDPSDRTKLSCIRELLIKQPGAYDLSIKMDKDDFTIQAFKKKLIDNGNYIYYGAAATWDFFIDFLFKSFKGQQKYIIRNFIGWHDIYKMFIFDNCIIKNQKRYDIVEDHCEIDGKIYYMEKVTDVPAPIIDEKPIDLTHEEKVNIINHVQTLIGSEDAITLVGFLVSTLFVNQLFKSRLISTFPLYFVYGRSGTGKTESLRRVMRIMGYESSQFPNIGNVTQYAERFDATHISSLPVVRDEFENRPLIKKKFSLFRSYFDRAAIAKLKDMNKRDEDAVKIDKPLSTMIISGIETPTDDATLNRMVILDVDAKKRERLSYKFFGKYKYDYNTTFIEPQYVGCLPYYILTQYSYSEIKEFFKKYKRVMVELNLDFPQRMIDNYVICFLGYMLFIFPKDKIMQIMDSEIFSIAQKFVSPALQNQQISVEYENAVSMFFDNCSNMYDLGDLEYTSHFVSKMNDGTIGIATGPMFEKMIQRNKEFPIEKVRTLNNYLMNIYDSRSTTRRVHNNTYRVIVFEPTNCPEQLLFLLEKHESYFNNFTGEYGISRPQVQELANPKDGGAEKIEGDKYTLK